MQTLALRAGGMLFAVIAIFMAGWSVCKWKYESAYKNQYAALIKQVNDAQLKNQQMSNFYNQILNQSQPEQNKVNKDVKVEIEKYPVYIDCKYTPDGMQSVKSTIDQANKIKSAQ